MKTIVLFLLVINSAFAQINFLNTQEANQINQYMDFICPDTYCGGDISFWTHGITCEGSTCSIEMTGNGHSDFSDSVAQTLIGKDLVTKEYTDAVLRFSDFSVEQDEEDEYQNSSMSFTCTLRNLPLEMTDLRAKRELFYDMIVWGCIRELEDAVYGRL